MRSFSSSVLLGPVNSELDLGLRLSERRYACNMSLMAQLSCCVFFLFECSQYLFLKIWFYGDACSRGGLESLFVCFHWTEIVMIHRHEKWIDMALATQIHSFQWPDIITVERDRYIRLPKCKSFNQLWEVVGYNLVRRELAHHAQDLGLIVANNSTAICPVDGLKSSE